PLRLAPRGGEGGVVAPRVRRRLRPARPRPGPAVPRPAQRLGRRGPGSVHQARTAAADHARPARGRRRRLRREDRRGPARLPEIKASRRRRRARPEDVAHAGASYAPEAEAATETTAEADTAAWLRRLRRPGRH